MTTATPAAKRKAYRARLTADAAAARAEAALRPRTVTAAEAGAVVRPATDSGSGAWSAAGGVWRRLVGAENGGEYL